LGVAAELLLTSHFESFTQLIPLILMGASLLPLVARTVDRSTFSLRLFQAVMVLLMLSGLLGGYLHHEFKMGFHATGEWWEKSWKALTATSPPALAPGAMILLGMLGLLYTYRHPAFSRGKYAATSTMGDE
jgi:hypothetical protein